MTSPEVALDTMERVLDRQGSHIPMTPRDIEMMRTAIHDMRIYRRAELERRNRERTAEIVKFRRVSA